jgi:heterodisulfide reductase subunit A
MAEPHREPTSRDETAPAAPEEPRIGVYVCTCGGNIGDVVDTEAVARALGKLPNVVVARSYIFMCSEPGQNMIAEDIREHSLNRVVVGACAPSLHELTFRGTLTRAGLNPYLFYHVGLREQDSWVHHHNPKAATEKAIRLMAAGLAKARLLKSLEPIELRAEKHALVIGGGVAGLRSALAIARLGLSVTLLERSPFLGGRMAMLDRVFPRGENAREVLHGLIVQVLAEPGITVHTGAEVVGVKGYIGNFEVQVRQHSRGVRENATGVEAAIAACPVMVPDEFNGGLTRRKAIYYRYQGCYPAGAAIDWTDCTRCGDCLKAPGVGGIDLEEEPSEFVVPSGAIVVATGFTPYEPPVGEYGFGQLPGVITLPQLERVLAADGPTGGRLEWDGLPVRRVAMIHCVGSRQVEGLHGPQPDGEVNNYCSRVCCTAVLNAANEIRERFPGVDVFDLYQDIRTYGRGHETHYLNASRNRVTFLRYFAEEPPEVARAPEGEPYPILVKVKDQLTWGEEIEVPVDLVVLAVGMMPTPITDLHGLLNISPGHDRFLLEVHPKLRPVETASAGIVLAGTAQGPMTIQESCAAASAAASKVAVMLRRGEVELEPYVAQVDPERCNGSMACVEICPTPGALEMIPAEGKGGNGQQARVVTANCKGCGLCVSACANRAIDLLGWGLDQYEAMVDALTEDLPGIELTV